MSIRAERTIDTLQPVSKTNAHVSDMQTKAMTHMPHRLARSGYSRKRRNVTKMLRCSPDSASTWLAPDTENACLVSLLIPDFSPNVKAANTEARPDEVRPARRRAPRLDGGRATVRLPALSWNVVRFLP